MKKRAGRPPITDDRLQRETITLRVPKWILEELAAMGGNRTEHFINALCKQHKLRKPDGR